MFFLYRELFIRSLEVESIFYPIQRSVGFLLAEHQERTKCSGFMRETTGIRCRVGIVRCLSWHMSVLKAYQCVIVFKGRQFGS